MAAVEVVMVVVGGGGGVVNHDNCGFVNDLAS